MFWKQKLTNTLIPIRNLKLWTNKSQGAAEEADRAEALEFVSSRVSVWHASPPEMGAADIYALPPLSPTSELWLCVWGFGL